MDRGTESFESPLDEVLEGLPDEQPPADLKDRCLAALQAPVRRITPAWMQVMRNVAAAAAVLMIVAGAYNLTIVPAREEARMATGESSLREPEAAGSVADEPAAEEADQARVEVGGGNYVFRDGLHATEPAPAASPRANGDTVERYITSLPEPGAPPGERPISFAHPAAAPGALDEERARDATGFTGYAGTRIAEAPAETPPPAPALGGAMRTPAGDRAGRSVTEGETDPWRDMSGERQVSYHKEMEIEVADVEKAHSDVRGIIEKRGGYVASDQVRIEEDGTDSARMTIRLPVHAYEDAIEDLRELGEVVRLVGESVDRTHEYYTQGAEVRELADREADLIRRFEQEENAARKRALKQQLDALRAQMHASKNLLERLSEETHWPVLELVLTEAHSGPAGFLGRSLRGSVDALAWVGATAIIWLPAVVIVTLFWRRRTS